MRSSLARLQGVTPLTDEEIHRMASLLYHEKRKVLVDLSEIYDADIRQGVIEYANRKFGKGK